MYKLFEKNCRRYEKAVFLKHIYQARKQIRPGNIALVRYRPQSLITMLENDNRITKESIHMESWNTHLNNSWVKEVIIEIKELLELENNENNSHQKLWGST